MSNQSLVWHINRAKFAFEDPDEYEEWKDDPKVFFELSPTQSDDGGETVFKDPHAAGDYYEVDSAHGTIKMTLEEDGPIISAWVLINKELVDGLTDDDVREWSAEQAGWACSTIDLGDVDASITEDEGGNLRFAE